jgi:hypothetical protein
VEEAIVFAGLGIGMAARANLADELAAVFFLGFHTDRMARN